MAFELQVQVNINHTNSIKLVLFIDFLAYKNYNEINVSAYNVLFNSNVIKIYTFLSVFNPKHNTPGSMT